MLNKKYREEKKKKSTENYAHKHFNVFFLWINFTVQKISQFKNQTCGNFVPLTNNNMFFFLDQESITSVEEILTTDIEMLNERGVEEKRKLATSKYFPYGRECLKTLTF